MFLASTTVAVYRDSDTTDVNVFGDPTETGAAVPFLSSVPVSVAEVKEDRGAPADLTNDVVRHTVMRVAQRWGIREGDRLRDDRTGDWYQVHAVRTPQPFAGVPPCTLTCKRIGA